MSDVQTCPNSIILATHIFAQYVYIVLLQIQHQMMENSSDETAAKFIDALIQALQTLCHGYLEFKTGVEIIGHINLSVDKENSHDYILKEKVCRLEGNSSFISNSFHAVPEGGTAHDSHTADTDSQGWRQGVSAFEDDNNPDLNGLSSPDSYQKGVRRKSSEEETGQFHPAKCSRLGNFSNTTTTTDVSAFPSRCVSPEDSKLGLHMTVSSAESEASHGCGELETGLHLALAAVAEVSVAKSKLTAAQKTGKNVDSSTGCAVDVVRDAFEPMPVQICRKRTDVENSCESVTIIKQEIQEEDSADDSADSSSHGLMRMSYHTGTMCFICVDYVNVGSCVTVTRKQNLYVLC